MENYESIIEPKKVYSQVYSILQLMGNSYIKKIPKKFYKLIDSKRDKTYNPTYNLDTNFIEQNVNKKALSIICLIDLKYWCNEEEKRSITQKIKKNQLIINQKNQELYNNIFKKNNINEDKSIKSKEIMIITKENFFIRIIHIIKKFFLRKLKNK